MELTFTNNGDYWFAEFTAKDTFNIHIEGVKESGIKIYQSSLEGSKRSYVDISSNNPSPFSEVFDMDFSAIIYPKYIRVECATEPSVAIITSNGAPE